MAEKTINPDAKITLRNVKVIFANLEDEGFGRSITIDCTAPELTQAIEDWVKKNNIGKDNPGVPNFKEYAPEGKEPTLQYAFKINDRTKFAGINGLDKEDLGYGAIVDLTAQAFTYNNKFSGGKDKVSQSLSAVVIRSGATTSNDDDLADLLGDVEDEEVTDSSIPF